MPGIQASFSRWILVMVQFPLTCSSDTVAWVARRLGEKPALPKLADNAIVKQPACAAAMSSSGLVPAAVSKRVANEYGVSFSTPLCVASAPWPLLRSPDQIADAVRFIAMLLRSCA